MTSRYLFSFFSAQRPPIEQNEGCKSWAHVFQPQNQTEISWQTSRNDVLFEPIGSLLGARCDLGYLVGRFLWEAFEEGKDVLV